MASPRDLLSGARSAAAKVLKHTPATGAAHQTLTVEQPAERVLTAVRDASVLSRLLGEAGTVDAVGDRYTWRLGDDRIVTTLTETSEGLDFLRVPGGGEHAAGPAKEHAEDLADDTEGGAEATSAPLASFRVTALPNGLRTEVRLQTDLPGGTAEFTVLYRLRALLQTGEIPTITPQPSGRKGDR
ncbi:hypothetical protein [Kineococcus sp. SYSU DK003]|uniref:hypothetical protein n=1 Tax=Kineococcus sp. SYSU DK003 TaxID=3383124 RepID=UPI003D7C49C4